MRVRRHKIQRERLKLLIFAGLTFAISIAVEPVSAQQQANANVMHRNSQILSRGKAPVGLRADLQKASNDYRSNVEELLALYEAESKKAEAQVAKARALLADGLVTRREVETAEQAAAQTRIKVAEAETQLKSAEMLIAEATIEVEAEESNPKLRLGIANRLVQTTAYTRYGGGHAWSLSDASVIKQFFARRFGRALPIGAFGQSALHDRWGYDHRNAMDIGVSPDTPEGQTLMEYLRSNGIPFTAFHFAVAGKATGPHIHVGLPSHRIATRWLAANTSNVSR